MPQIETAYFITRLPPGLLPRLRRRSDHRSSVCSPGRVDSWKSQISGKRNFTTEDAGKRMDREIMRDRHCVSLLLFHVRYFIAWKNEAVRAYYGGSDPGSFVTHITNLLRAEPLLFLLQVVRALLWLAIAVPVIKMMKGAWWESGLAVALLFA